MSTSNLRSYEYNVICPVCGEQKKDKDMQKRWDGQFVCKNDWEPRHSLDFYKNRSDTHKLPFILDNDEITTTNDVSPAVNGTYLKFENEISRGTFGGASGGTFGQATGLTVKQFFYGGTVSAIYVNGTLTGFTSGVVTLRPEDTVRVDYTVAPNFIRFT